MTIFQCNLFRQKSKSIGLLLDKVEYLPKKVFFCEKAKVIALHYCQMTIFQCKLFRQKSKSIGLLLDKVEYLPKKVIFLRKS